MSFSSVIFISCFLPLFFIFYFPVKNLPWRNTVLCVFSLLFYAWGEPVYILLMLFTLAVNYLFGRLIGRALPDKKRAKTLLILITAVDLGLLGVFKYAGFLLGTVFSLTGAGLTPPSILLPIGISFYTFQILSYVIDVYRGEVSPQKNIVWLGAYLAAFPQLIAGPIVRYRDIAEELEQRRVTADDIADGLRRFVKGLSKKMLIANQAAVVADALFAESAASLGAVGAWTAALAYTVQIYYDFSGYSDMAIGLGRMMGFRYPENFDHPYASRSVTEFWRRWHMTLSSFFRDYVYIPLGGNRVGRVHRTLNIMIVWLLTGLWHGASWNFVVWGLCYGVLLLFEKRFLPEFGKRLKLIPCILTMTVTVVGWVLFRAETLPAAGRMLAGMTGAYGFAPAGLAGLLLRSGFGGVFLLSMIAGIVFAFPHRTLEEIFPREGKILDDVLTFALFFACCLSLAAQAYNPFIYFRF